jgi:hypothetical protein
VLVVGEQDPHIELAVLLGHRPLGQQHGSAGVGKDVPLPLGRVVHVQRQVRGTGLEHGEQRDRQRHRPLQRDRDQRLRPDAHSTQRRGDAFGAVVELAVRQRRRAARHRDLVRGGEHLAPHQFVDREVRRRVLSGAGHRP